MNNRDAKVATSVAFLAAAVVAVCTGHPDFAFWSFLLAVVTAIDV